MSHLSMEALARLVEEAPREEEAGHLERCAACREELAGMREQTELLGSLAGLRAPRDQWPALAARLRSEGLIRRRGTGSHPLLRIAAALALFLAGGIAGAGVWAGVGLTRGAEAPVRTAAAPRTAEEARAAVRTAEAAYLEALTRAAEIDGAGEAVDPANRLAALEGIMLTTGAALREAPADPVINSYHLAALSQREAMLRRISTEDGAEWF